MRRNKGRGAAAGDSVKQPLLHRAYLPGDPMMSSSRSSTARTRRLTAARPTATPLLSGTRGSRPSERCAHPSPCGRRCAASARPGRARPQNPGMVETLPNLPIGSIYLFRLLAGCRSREGLSVPLSDAYEYGSKLAYVITPSTN